MPTAVYRPQKQVLSGKERWWQANAKNVAQRLQEWCDGIENRSWDKRFQNLTFWRYLTGREASFSFNLSSVARPAAAMRYKRAVFTPPVKNIIGQCFDTLNNRVFKNRPALQICGDATDYDQQFQAIEQTRYLDAAFADGMWPLVEEACQDGAAFGSGFILVDTGLDGKKVCKSVVKQDEVIVDEAEAATTNVKTLAIRFFVNKHDLLDAFAPDPLADSYAAVVTAIDSAPKAELGFFWGDMDTTDICVLRRAWHLDPDGRSGRHVIATTNYAFVDEKYELDHFPLAKFVFKQLGFFGQGGVEQSLGLQREHNRMSMALWENFRRIAWPRIGIPAGQGINEGELSDKSGGFYHFKDKDAVFNVAKATNPEQFEYLQTIERGIKEIWRVSEQAAAGLPLPGSNSGRARLVQDQIDDRAHIQPLLHLEDFVTQIGYLLIEAMARVKPTLTLPGRATEQVKWVDFGKSKLRAFPLSSIPQSIPGRQDWIDRAFAEGRISKETKTRLENLPDVDGEVDLMDASQNSVRKACFDMLKTGKYIPPSGFGDLPAQFAYVQSKVLLEQNRKVPAPHARISLLFRYAAALDELIADAQPSAPGFGMAPPAGVPGVPTGTPPTPGLPTPAAGFAGPPQ